MRSGIVEIQDWDLDGIVSGRVTSDNFSFDFWARQSLPVDVD